MTPLGKSCVSDTLLTPDPSIHTGLEPVSIESAGPLFLDQNLGTSKVCPAWDVKGSGFHCPKQIGTQVTLETLGHTLI